MGVLYSVLPYDARMREAVKKLGYAGPFPGGEGRNPTPAEIRHVVAGLDGFKASYNDPPTMGQLWQVTVEDALDPDTGRWTLVNMSKYAGENVPEDIWFEKGWPDLIVRILLRLATTCGALVVVPDTGEAPLVVAVGDEEEDLLARWEHTAGSVNESSEE